MNGHIKPTSITQSVQKKVPRNYFWLKNLENKWVIKSLPNHYNHQSVLVVNPQSHKVAWVILNIFSQWPVLSNLVIIVMLLFNIVIVLFKKFNLVIVHSLV